MNKAEIVRQKVTKLVKLLTEKNIEVTQRGSQAQVEYDTRTLLPVRVNIPYIADDATEDFLSAIEGFLDHEVGHVLFSDGKALVEANRLNLANMCNIVEDTFIERKMSESFGGSKYNLNKVGEFFLKNYTDKKIKEDPKNIQAYLMVPAIRAFAGQAVFADYMSDKWHELADIVSRIEIYAREALPNIQNSFDSLAVATELNRLMREEKEKPSEEPAKGKDGKGEKPDDKGEGAPKPSKSDKVEDEDDVESDSDEGEEGELADADDSDEDDSDLDDDGEDADEGDDSKAKDSSGEDSKGESKKDSKTKDTTEGESSDEDAEGDSETDAEKSEKPSESNKGGSGTVGDDLDREGVETKEFEEEDLPKIDVDALMDKLEDFDEGLTAALSDESTKDAKKTDYIIYTRDLDYVGPLLDKHYKNTSDDEVRRMTDASDHMVAPLQKDLERAIAARSAVQWTGGHRKGRINSSSLARLTMFNDERAFKQKQQSKSKDVAISLLVDASSSMSDSKIRTATYAAYGLSAVLDRLNITHEVLGFSTKKGYIEGAVEEQRRLGIRYGRNYALYIPVFKSFQERMNSEVKKRLASLSNAAWLNENVDGESVQIAASRLSQRPEKRKILIVLSDGSPCCPGDRNALVNHLKSTLREIEKTDIEVLGIGIEDNSVAEFYKKHIVLNDLKDLPTTVISRIKSILMQ